MPIAARHVKDAAPSLPPLATLTVRRTSSPLLMSSLQQRRVGEMIERFAAGHRAYVAWYDGEPAAFGWVATRGASIGPNTRVWRGLWLGPRGVFHRRRRP